MVWGPTTGSCLETAVNSTNNVWQVNTASGSEIPGCSGQSGFPAGLDVVVLYSDDTNSRKQVWEKQGYYRVPFQFTIQAQ